MNKMTTSLWFDSQAEEAAKFYISIFKNGKVLNTDYYGKEGFEHHGKPEGSVLSVEFEVNGQTFIGVDGGPIFTPNESMSLMVYCETQKEIDDYWEKLTANGGKESMCGWLKDKYGFSWQIVPTVFHNMLKKADKDQKKRLHEAMFKMKKLDIAAFERAFAGK